MGADVSPLALQVADKNAVSLEVSDRAVFVESDLFSSAFFQQNTGKDMPQYDILISNPPYIRSAEIEELMEEVRDHDPDLHWMAMKMVCIFIEKSYRRERLS